VKKTFVTNLEADEFSLTGDKGKTDEEELLQAESEHDGTVEQDEQTPASTKK
jgi:hypothetical protein